MITLVYLAIQVRDNTKIVSAQTRHALSEFVLRISIFRVEHGDRFAKLESGTELTDGDRQFQYWRHVQMLPHAESSSPRAMPKGDRMSFFAELKRRNVVRMAEL